ncbi:uncharacterized protein [Eucyclogobius newberryi]|uniref:uncharacterized protein n=1 Tax=Eucyclogobius newberryi TaxID=166745 RepID=UPI003B5BD0E1
MEDADIGDTHSLDSSGSGIQASDENHSSSSEAEAFGQEEEQGSEIGRRGEERMTCGLSELCMETEDDIQAPQTVELLVSAEEPHIETKPAEFMQVVPPMALPPLPILQLDPPSTTSTPVFCTTAGETEEFLSTPQGLHPPSILTPINPPIVKTAADDLGSSQKHSVQASSPQRDHSKSKPAKIQTITEMPVLLCGGAALVAVVGVMAYGAVALLRK